MALQKAKKGGVETTPFKFQNKGDVLKGYYQGQVSKTINGNPAVEHTYKTENGVYSVLGQANILTQLKYNDIKPGTYVEIEFSGQMQRLKNGRTMKVYDVSFDLENIDNNVVEPTEESYNDEVSEEENHFDDVVPQKRTTKPVASPTIENQKRVQALLNSARK